MIIDNVYVFTPDKAFVKGGIILDGDKIRQVYEEKDAPQLNGDVLDGKGCYAIPGLIDLHFHGCKGDDFCDGDKAAIGRIAEYEASVGVTAIAPATMTLPVEELEQILHTAAEYKKEQRTAVRRIFWESIWKDLLSARRKKGHRTREISCHVMWKSVTVF